MLARKSIPFLNNRKFLLDEKVALLWQGICSESVKFASFIYVVEKGGILGYFVPLQYKAFLKSMTPPPCLQAQLLSFIESLEKGLLAHKYSCGSCVVLKSG